MRIRLGICSLWLSLAALAAGCGGGGRDVVERQLAELRAELVRVRADNAVLADRVGSLERARSAARDAAPSQPAAARAALLEEPDRPELEVVRLAPVDDAAPPPVLRSTPGGVVVDERPGGSPKGQPHSTPSRRAR